MINLEFLIPGIVSFKVLDCAKLNNGRNKKANSNFFISLIFFP